MPKKPSQPANPRTQAGRLRIARERAGYSSPRVAAEALEWNENTYKSHENGLRGSDGIKLKHLRKYARAFGVSYEWLVSGSGPLAMTPQDAEWQTLSEEERATALRLLEAARQVA